MPKLNPSLRRWLSVLLAAIAAVAGTTIAIDLDDDGRPDVNVTINSPSAAPAPLSADAQRVLDAMRSSDEADEHTEHAATPELAPSTVRANDRAVEDGTYDASGVVQGAAGAPARIECLTGQHGNARAVTKIGLGTVHTTQGPNVKGLADIQGLCRWFREQQLSSTWLVDDEGNSALVVPLGFTPWTQWKWNTWSCSIEFVGYAERSAAEWTAAQLREGARLMTQCFKTAGIPIRRAVVAGTGAGQAPRIVTTGVATHKQLGYNGGGHVDPGPTFPMARFLELMRSFATGAKPAVSLGSLTHAERQAAATLTLERRVARRHGGWEKIAAVHLRNAEMAKRFLLRANERIHAEAKRTGWDRGRRRARHAAIHALVSP